MIVCILFEIYFLEKYEFGKIFQQKLIDGGDRFVLKFWNITQVLKLSYYWVAKNQNFGIAVFRQVLPSGTNSHQGLQWLRVIPTEIWRLQHFDF